MNEIKNTTPRRSFLGTLASGAAALGLMSIAPLKLKAEELGITLGSSAAGSNAGDEAEAWFNQVKGKHRIVYDATAANAGYPLAWSWVFLNTNNETGTPDNDLAVVLVLRHEAIPLAMKDDLWAKYKFGEFFKLDDPKTKAPSTRNYFWNSQEGDLMIQDWSIDRLQKRGVKVCVCAMAIKVYSMLMAKANGGNADDIQKDWLAGIEPNIQVVPSGVWALGRAQEHECKYVFAGG